VVALICGGVGWNKRLQSGIFRLVWHWVQHEKKQAASHMWTLRIPALCSKQLRSAIKVINFLPFERFGHKAGRR